MNCAFAGATMFALCGLVLPAAAAPLEVDMKLVIATDVSRSISNGEARLQRDGTAEAFRSPDIIKAIQSGALGRIAVAMIDFSSPQYNRIVLNWTIINDEKSAMAFADRIRSSPRTPGGRTSISGALELGTLLLEASEQEIVANRRVIDVSGDGPNNDGNFMKEAHDKALAAGITVNGLPVMDQNANGYFPNLDKYYAGCVVGGKGAFVVVVRAFGDFGPAMRHKLILEISQDESQIKQALADLQSGGLLQTIAAEPDGAAPEPQVLRPSKDYPGGCDIGGFGFGGF
jgi:hypothetical protein